MRPRLLHRLRPWLLLAGWLAGVALLIVAILLQRRIWIDQNPSDLTPFWAVLGCGIAFAALATVRLSTADGRSGRSLSEGRTGPLHLAGSAGSPNRRDLWDGWLGLGMALLCEAAALTLFAREERLTLAWVLHLFAGAMLILGVKSFEPRGWRGLTGGWSRSEAALVLALVTLALVARSWQLGSIPRGVWYDESQRGNEALRILVEPQYRPVFTPGATVEATGFWYLVVPFVAALGRDPLAVRLPAAIGGALGVGAVYVLARQLFDRRTAFAAAGLLLGMTWHFNFSRVGFPTIWSATLDTLAAALFVRGIQRRSILSFAAAGVTAGAGLYFYYTSLLLPLILATLALHQLASRRLELVRSCGVGLVVCALGFLIAAGPFGQFAMFHPREFNQRTSTVSIGKEIEQAGSWQPLVQNVKAHLLMFNVRGDPNGRHNWSGRPMLDEVTGALAVLGFALALSRIWRLQYFFALAWFAASMVGGVMSITWEAPQGNRTMDVVTALALFSALPLAALWRASDLSPAPGSSLARRRLGLASASTVGFAAVALVAATDAHNFERYFVNQQQDFRTWMEFTTPLTEAARQINDVPLNWEIYLPPSFVREPTITFLVRQPRRYTAFEPAAHLPISDTAAAIFLTEQEAASAARIAELYPGAVQRTLRAPTGSEVQLYSFMAGREDVRSDAGVIARYGPSEGGELRRESRLDFGWPTDAPLPPPFGAAFQTSLKVPASGPYRLKLEGPNDANLLLDGRPILSGGRQVELKLAVGLHALHLDAPTAGQEPLRLLWAEPGGRLEPLPERLLFAPPVTTSGLVARLYPGREPSGPPSVERIDPAVALRVHVLPLDRPYTIEWSGSLRVAWGGSYRFGTDSRDDSFVWIDDRQVVANAAGGYAEARTTLDVGWHNIRVRFLDATSFTHVALYWQPPGEARAIVPSRALRPWPADRVSLAQPDDISTTGGLAIPPAPPAEPSAALESEPQTSLEAPTEQALRPGSGTAPAGSQLESAGALVKPRGATMRSDGTIFVADAARGAVIALPPGGSPLVWAEGQLDEPSAVAALPDGSLVVSEAGSNTLRRIAPDGRLGERFVPAPAMYRPRGITAAPDGRLAIADTGSGRVLIVALDGGVLTIPNLNQPTDAALLPDGTILVAETGAQRLTIVRLDGRHVASWSMPPSGTEAGPHVAVLPGGGWVATLSEKGALARMPANGSEPEVWATNPSWRRPSGIAAGPTSVIVIDAEGASADVLDVT